MARKGGVREGMMGKEILKKDGGFPFQHAHRMQSRFFKDNQLRCKCSTEGGLDKEEPCFHCCTKRVCGEVGWWQLNAPNLNTSASHCFTYLLKRLIHAFILVAKWASLLSHTHTCMLQRHISDPKQGLRSLNTITFSFLLGGRKNSGATHRLLCSCGKTHGRLSQCSLGLGRTRAQLLNRKSPPAWPCASNNPPRCLVGSR